MAKVYFCDAHGRAKDPVIYVLDLDAYLTARRVTTYGEHDAAKALREMSKLMKRWTDHNSGVRVYTRDGDAIAEQQRLHYERPDAHEHLSLIIHQKPR